jgi:hypothetical protein
MSKACSPIVACESFLPPQAALQRPRGYSSCKSWLFQAPQGAKINAGKIQTL